MRFTTCVFVTSCLGLASANQVLRTSGFVECQNSADISVKNVDVTYDATAKTVTFNIAGSSSRVMNVTAELSVTAYGKSVYSNTFRPCDPANFVEQLCPVPAGDFAAVGVQDIPEKYASMIPSMAFSVPDIAARATLKLKDNGGGNDAACIQSQVTNGKSAEVPAVSYVAASIAGLALIVSGASAGLGAGASASGGLGSASPTFVDTFLWLQTISMNGMLSVDMPPVYRSFTQNFAFSTGLVPWNKLQSAIDSFRGATGGNTTNNNVRYFLENRNGTATTSNVRRSLDYLVRREAEASELEEKLSGIKKFSEDLMIPASNTFMTVLLVAAIVIAAIAVGILAFKLILEAWALFGSFPKSLTGFRKHYWGTMGRTIVQLILVLYGVWVLYCVFQFTQGDSWAAQTLAAVTLALFTAILGYFTFKIWRMAQHLKKAEGDASGLYQDKQTWMKYSIFYDVYKKDYWWVFVPVIIYMFAKGVILAAGEGHGFGQTIAQLIVESLMLALLIWKKPFERKSGNVINIFIQVVRALSVICIIVFVQELGVEETSQTVVGLVLIIVQSVLTGLLGILILINAIILMVKENPHRKRRKELEKANRDTLTPLGPMEEARYTNSSKLNMTGNTNNYDSSSLGSGDHKNGFIFETTNSTPLQTLAPERGLKPNGHRPMKSQDSREHLLAEFDNSPPPETPLRAVGVTGGGTSGNGGGYRGVAF